MLLTKSDMFFIEQHKDRLSPKEIAEAIGKKGVGPRTIEKIISSLPTETPKDEELSQAKEDIKDEPKSENPPEEKTLASAGFVNPAKGATVLTVTGSEIGERKDFYMNPDGLRTKRNEGYGMGLFLSRVRR